MRKIIDITGNKYNMLTVLRYDHSSDDKGRSYWLCKCDCGNEKVILSDSLKNGNTKSCGCLKKQNNQTNGLWNTRIYNIWRNMKGRCYNPKSYKNYKHYGGRGIKVCDEWLNDFKSFYNWSITHGYRDDLTIDRIDVNGNYEPSNCRWITMQEQNRNKRSNKQ